MKLGLTPRAPPYSRHLPPPSSLPSAIAPSSMATNSPLPSGATCRLSRASVSCSSLFSTSSLKLIGKGKAPRSLGICASVGNFSSDGPALKASDAASAIDFLTLCHRLKATKRKGWVNHGIKGPESIADHMYRMAVMALIAEDLSGVNRERCIKIAIVHDIAEAIVGDITPSDGVPKEEKSRLEQAALNEMCEILGGGMRANELKELWAEYENNSSIEASLVKDFDKVEMILQALEYETEHGKVLDEFFLSTAGKFQTDVGRRWAAEVTSRRNKRLRNLNL